MIMPVSLEVSPNTDSWQDSRWPPLIAILVAGALYAVLPSNYVLAGRWFGWIIPSLEVVLVIVAASAPPSRREQPFAQHRHHSGRAHHGGQRQLARHARHRHHRGKWAAGT